MNLTVPERLARSTNPEAVLALATLISATGCPRSAAPAAPDREIEAAGTWAGLSVRTAGERKKPRQVVILLHGWGAPGDDLVPLGQVLGAPGRLLVFPAAPLVSPGGGRAWWHLDLARLQAARERGQDRDLRNEVPEGLPEARKRVLDLVAEVSRRTGLPPSSIVLGGFSQGAMLSFDVALAATPALAGVVVLSGTLVAESTWTAQLAARPKPLPVFQSHGQYDQVLPFRLAEALRDHIQAARGPLTWVPFAGGHEIPMPVLTALVAFLDRTLAPAP